MVTSALRRYAVPDLPQAHELLPYLKRLDETRQYSNFGPLVKELEQGIRGLLAVSEVDGGSGSRLEVATMTSGYHALEIGLRLSAKSHGCVLMPAITFVACPLAAQHAGLEPALVDVDPVSWTLTPAIARAALRQMDVSAVMPVAVYGVPLPAAEWDRFTEETGVPVVIDAAAALGAQAVPRGCLVAYSLHATKPFGIGEGGILVGCDTDLIEQAKIHTNFGTIERVGYMDGSNAKMSEYHAAVGLAQLQRWLEIKQRRADLLDSYVRHMRSVGYGLAFQEAIQTAVVSLLMVELKNPIAERLIQEAAHDGIALHRSYLPPLYRHPNFSNLMVIGADGRALPRGAHAARKYAHMVNCERLRQCLVGVPFHRFMTEEDVFSMTRYLADKIEMPAPQSYSEVAAS